jgi:uncharacterized membrane protein YgcG
MDCQIREGETLPPIHRAVIKYIKKLRLRPFLNAAIACGSVVLLAVPGKGLATAGLFGFDLVGDAVADGVGLGTVLKAISGARMNREKSVRSAIHAWRTAADDHIPRFARSLGIQSLKLSRGEGDSADPKNRGRSRGCRDSGSGVCGGGFGGSGGGGSGSGSGGGSTGVHDFGRNNGG